MSKFLKQYQKKNHAFTTILFHRKFLGYQKVKSKLKQKNKQKALSSDNLQKEYLPFETEYQINYKDKFLNSLKQPEVSDMSICNLSKINSIKNNSFFFSSIKPTKSKCLITESTNFSKNNTIESTKDNLIKKIFKNKEELNKINDLFLVPMTRNQHNYFTHSNNVIYNNFSPEEKKKSYYSLYKNAHKRINTTEKNNSSINENQNFEISINNLSKENKKISYINNLKNKIEIFKKQLNEFRTTPIYLRKLFENEFTSNNNKIDDNPSENNNQITFSNDTAELPMNINLFKNEEIRNLALKSSLIMLKKNFFSPQKNVKFSKKMQKYPPNFYKTFLLLDRNKKYENIQKNALKKLHKTINIKSEDEKDERPLALGVMAPNRNLHKKIIKNNKYAYQHESRLRDLTIANKLKFEFDETDIQRILNGKKPWKDFGLNKSNYNSTDKKNLEQNDLKSQKK